MKFRGWQVAPAGLEAILLTHRSNINAAVIGKPGPGGTGEGLRAYVQLKPKPTPDHEVDEKEVTQNEVKQYIKERLLRYKWLDGGVRSVDDIPRMEIEKLQRENTPRYGR